MFSQVYVGLHVQYRHYCQVVLRLEFCRQFFLEILKCLNFTEIHAVRAGCYVRTDGRTDGQTDVTKLIVAFRWLRTRQTKLIFSLDFRFIPHSVQIFAVLAFYAE